jgi:hypothetical protein
MSPLDLLTTKDQLREVLRSRCDAQDLDRVVEWAWTVLSGYRLLQQAVLGQVTVGFDPDMDGPVFTRK